MELTKMSTNLLDSMHEARALANHLEVLIEQKVSAEYDYQIASAKKRIALKDKNVPVSHIEGIIRGLPEVAELRLERDLADEKLKAAYKKLSILSDVMSGVQSLLKYQSEV